MGAGADLGSQGLTGPLAPRKRRVAGLQEAAPRPARRAQGPALAEQGPARSPEAGGPPGTSGLRPESRLTSGRS